MRTRLAVLLACVLPLALAPAPAVAAAPAAVALGSVIPAPTEVRPHGPGFRLTGRTVIVAPASARPAADLLAEAVRAATGHRLAVVKRAPRHAAAITLAPGRTGAENYTLSVGRKGVTIRSGGNSGLFNGVQTLRQLLPLRAPWTIAGGEIVDRPRFAYRGVHLDLARHFHTVAEVKRYIDEVSQFKVNYLHLHLSDDQGWRIQIDSWPRLTSVGGAAGTGVDGVGGGFLTKAEYRDLVRHAASRSVTIVPEIDLPGHVNAAQVAYPELTCDGVAPPPRTDTAVGYSSLCIGKEITYRFVEDVIRELAALTPGPLIHIGGNEALTSPQADYVAFLQRVLPLVGKYGKTAYGWNEITQAPASHTAIAQYWNTGTTNPSLVAAVAAGTKVIMSPANKAYLDMKYDRSTVLGLSWAGYIEVRTAYDWDPGTHVAGVPESAVLGVEAPLWSETLRSIDDIEFMAFPRLAALAELGWSPARDWESFRTRLGAYGPRWTARGVGFYPSPQIDWAG